MFRTSAQLHDFLSANLIWRKKELTQYKFLLDAARGRDDRKSAVLRACITMLYAHWEGFVKEAGGAYLRYLAGQKLKYEELSPNFIALCARGVINQSVLSKKSRIHTELVKFFLNRLAEKGNVPYKDAIPTRANLSSEVLEDIVGTLGLDYKPFEGKGHLIDEGLLRLRNTIAHGEFLDVSEDRYIELYQSILEMMETFRNQIDNAVVTKAYLAA